MNSLLVVFALPEGTLASCWAENLAGIPARGRYYLLGGKLYEVVWTVESLGPQGGLSKLTELLSLVAASKAGTAPVIQDLTSVAGASSPGILTGPAHVLLVRLRPVRNSTTSVSPQPDSAGSLQFHVGDRTGDSAPVQESPERKRSSGRKAKGKRRPPR